MAASFSSPFDLLSNEVLEIILLHHFRHYQKLFWRLSLRKRRKGPRVTRPHEPPRVWEDARHFWIELRLVNRRFKLLVEGMASRLEKVSRILCQIAMPQNVFLEELRHMRLRQLDSRRLWNKWKRLNQIQRVVGASAKIRPPMASKVRALRYVGESFFVALDNGEMLWMDVDSSKIFYSSMEASPVDQIRCMSVNDLAPFTSLSVYGQAITITCNLVITVAQNRVLSTHFIEADPTTEQGFKITRTDLDTLSAKADVKLSTYRNFLYVSSFRQDRVWKFFRSAVASIVTTERYDEPADDFKLAWLWPSEGWMVYPSVRTTSNNIGCNINSNLHEGWLSDLKNNKREQYHAWPEMYSRETFPALSNVKRSFFFRNDVYVLLTVCKSFIVGLQYRGCREGSKCSSYDMMAVWNAVVTSVHMSLDVLFVGTEKGEVFAYRMKGFYLVFDLRRWDWSVRAGMPGAIVDMELVQGRDNTLSLVFANEDRIYTEIFA